jgi:hypothetical protein
MTEAEASFSNQLSAADSLPAIFEAVGASATGPRHLAAGKACEDCFKLELGNDWIVAAVSDGAGSADRAIDGATAVSEAICRTFDSRDIQKLQRNIPIFGNANSC